MNAKKHFLDLTGRKQSRQVRIRDEPQSTSMRRKVGRPSTPFTERILGRLRPALSQIERQRFLWVDPQPCRDRRKHNGAERIKENGVVRIDDRGTDIANLTDVTLDTVDLTADPRSDIVDHVLLETRLETITEA